MNFLYSNWLALSITTRMKIAVAFKIPKTGSTHVSNNVIQSDGYEIKAVEQALSLANIQAYLETREINNELLWHQLIDKVEGRVTPLPAPEIKPLEVVAGEPKTVPVVPVPIKRKYTKKI